MKAAALVTDLLLFSRIEGAARAAGAGVTRVTAPDQLPEEADLVFVDWSDREPGWASTLRARRRAGGRLILFGPHTDLAAHAAAREAGLGPMWARSRLVKQLPALFGSG